MAQWEKKKLLQLLMFQKLWTLQSKLLSAQQLPLAYEEPFTIHEALPVLSPVECHLRRWQHRDDFPGGSEKLSRLAEVIQLVTEGTRTQWGPTPACPSVLSSCSVTMASASCSSPFMFSLGTLFLSYFGPLDLQSSLDIPCSLLCDCRKEALLL